MDFRTNQWCREMLNCLENPTYREMAWNALPRIVDMNEPIGALADHVASEGGLPGGCRPYLFPTLDDQAAGLVGGGAVDDGQVAVILGNSAVVNSSSDRMPSSGTLDVMRLNWGPYLWMRCYSNGAQFLDRIVGSNPNWAELERAARAVAPGANGIAVMPFTLSEPSIGVHAPRLEWLPTEPTDPGVRFRAALEALAYLIGLGVKEHASAGQKIARITVSGGIAQSSLMCEILASVLDQPLQRLVSNEGPALGAAVTALAGFENYTRKQRGVSERYAVADAVAMMVRFRDSVQPVVEWRESYQRGLKEFSGRVKGS
jgi:sugar (pentulose or hexulose) kinase